MATFKIKAEDRAAFINRLKGLGIKIDTSSIKSGSDPHGDKNTNWVMFDVPDPEHAKKVKDMLKQSPAINVIKEMVREELKKYLEK